MSLEGFEPPAPWFEARCSSSELQRQKEAVLPVHRLTSRCYVALYHQDQRSLPLPGFEPGTQRPEPLWNSRVHRKLCSVPQVRIELTNPKERFYRPPHLSNCAAATYTL